MDELKSLKEEEQLLSQELDQKQEKRKATKKHDAELYKKLRDNHRFFLFY